MEKKTFHSSIELKSDESQTPGAFKAVFSTFNMVDHDGDVTIEGAFKNGQKVRVSYWGHRWSDLPVGKGTIISDQEKAWIDGEFFLDTEAGLETYKTVKNLGELQEWSYGFDILDSDEGIFEGKDVRFLRSLDVYEVSPVMLGAGIGTGTVSIKEAPSSISPQESISSISPQEAKPSPQEGESREDFVSRCIPIVLEEGTASSTEQAVAICNSYYDRKSITNQIPSDEAECETSDGKQSGVTPEVIQTQLIILKLED